MSVLCQIPDVYFRYYPPYFRYYPPYSAEKTKCVIPGYLNVYPNQPSREEREIKSLKIGSFESYGM